MQSFADTLGVPAEIDGMVNCGCEAIIEDYKAKLEELGLADLDKLVCPAMYKE